MEEFSWSTFRSCCWGRCAANGKAISACTEGRHSSCMLYTRGQSIKLSFIFSVYLKDNMLIQEFLKKSGTAEGAVFMEWITRVWSVTEKMQRCFSRGFEEAKAEPGSGCAVSLPPHHYSNWAQRPGGLKQRECLAGAAKYKRLTKYLHVTVI